MVIWIAGLSRAGKTTLCQEMARRLRLSLPHVVTVDGDDVRRMFGGDLGYTEADRVKQIGRLQALASMLARQDLIVLVAALYCNPVLLAWNRQNLPGYFEVYLRASWKVLRARDSKGLYRGAFGGTIPNVVGVDIPWHEPSAPDLTLDAGPDARADTLARRVIESVPGLARLPVLG
jgi:adenylylsulfate kinase